MKFTKFIYDKLIYIFFWTGYMIIFSLMLDILGINKFAIIFLDSIILVFNLFMIIYEYYKKSEFYNILQLTLNDLDKKYLISEIIKSPDFYEGKILYETLQLTNKSMNDTIAKYKLSMQEYREYIESWVHEIKTPIASSKLIVENNKNEVTLNIDEELDKIDALVEQALFYSRSNDVEKDYIISKTNLKALVSDYLKNNYKLFSTYNVSVEVFDLENDIYTDKKWVIFILSQIISNSIKYKANKIKIYSTKNENNVVLYIEDNGIGIDQKDISRVFEKGFTGLNGRKFIKSTGMGLYLCKKLCDKLDIEIGINSKIDEGTTLNIVFPKSNMYDV